MFGQGDSMQKPSMDQTGSGTGLPSPGGNVSDLWDVEDRYWADNFSTRPYAVGNEDYYERFRPAYRYGFESAAHHVGRTFDEAEPDLRTGWDRYEHRGQHQSAWDDVKDAVRDAWNRVTGHGGERPAERIGEAIDRASVKEEERRLEGGRGKQGP